MTLSELAQFDGRDGHPAYVAINGIIYDVSNSPLWQEGIHEEKHQAGQDLTAELKSAPHVKTVVERFPVVGQIEPQIEAEEKPVKGISLLSIIIIAFVVLLMIATYMI
ncbi:cytochrome b5 domain-containing protein [uncultured Desulfuromusa sp.]|uniref:cytochrome b5 domain-containing protein n=1 Tax=uncultured Desulfuromusa sp. TaxID=219183 RepID=UPI002AA712BE|nr:cytochrome b5 domain-containing protein [uncultured Desulfuromusa sp.]